MEPSDVMLNTTADPVKRRSDPFDVVKRPAHYNSHPSDVEAIEVCRLLGFDLGNVFKYIYRREGKELLRSLRSALWYFDDYQLHPHPKTAKMAQAVALLERIIKKEPDNLARAFYRKFADFLVWRTQGKAVVVRDRIVDMILAAETKGDSQ